jgi:hypothetical protein
MGRLWQSRKTSCPSHCHTYIRSCTYNAVCTSSQAHNTVCLLLCCAVFHPQLPEGGDGTPVAVPEDQLPLTLPETDNFKPSGTPESPLAVIDSWVNTTDPATGAFCVFMFSGEGGRGVVYVRL